MRSAACEDAKVGRLVDRVVVFFAVQKRGRPGKVGAEVDADHHGKQARGCCLGAMLAFIVSGKQENGKKETMQTWRVGRVGDGVGRAGTKSHAMQRSRFLSARKCKDCSAADVIVIVWGR